MRCYAQNTKKAPFSKASCQPRESSLEKAKSNSMQSAGMPRIKAIYDAFAINQRSGNLVIKRNSCQIVYSPTIFSNRLIPQAMKLHSLLFGTDLSVR